MKLVTKKKAIIVGLAVIVLGSVGTHYAVKVHAESKQVEKERTNLEIQFKKTIANIYLDGTQELVKSDVSPETLKQAQKLVKQSKTRLVTKKLVTSLKTGLLMESIQQELDSFFESEGVANYYSSDESNFSSMEVALEKVTSKKEFTVLQLEKIKILRVSYKEAEKAENAVVALFEGSSVNEGITRETYEQAKQQVEALKQVSLKEQLTEKLIQVDTKLTEKEAIQAADVKKEQEVQEQVKQAATIEANKKESALVATQSEGTGGSNSTGGSADQQGRGTSSTGGGTPTGSGSTGGASQQQSKPPVSNNNPGNNIKPGDKWEGNTTDTGLIGGQENAGNGGGGNTGGTIEW